VGTSGELLASAIDGLGVGAPLGDGLNVTPGLGLELGLGTPVGVAVDGTAVAGVAVDGLGVGICAICVGCPEPLARCWSSTPPMPSATVARTRFRRPRLRMRRAR
jgi:hypothetical protein